MEQFGDDNHVGRTGHWKEFRQPLNYGENHNVKPMHGGVSFRGCALKGLLGLFASEGAGLAGAAACPDLEGTPVFAPLAAGEYARRRQVAPDGAGLDGAEILP